MRVVYGTRLTFLRRWSNTSPEKGVGGEQTLLENHTIIDVDTVGVRVGVRTATTY